MLWDVAVPYSSLDCPISSRHPPIKTGPKQRLLPVFPASGTLAPSPIAIIFLIFSVSTAQMNLSSRCPELVPGCGPQGSWPRQRVAVNRVRKPSPKTKVLPALYFGVTFPTPFKRNCNAPRYQRLPRSRTTMSILPTSSTDRSASSLFFRSIACKFSWFLSPAIFSSAPNQRTR